jgi:hypothetical protein
MTLASVAYAMSLNAMAEDPVTAPGIEQMHGAEIVASGFPFGMLIIAVMGALCITGEYSTGMIRSTFAAVPTRLPVLAAKALTLVVLAAAVALVSVTLSYLVTMAQLSQYDLVPALDDPGTWRVFGGSVLKAVKQALGADGDEFTARSTFHEATAGWLAMFAGQVERGARSPSTYDAYRDVVRRVVEPGVGSLRLGEVTTPRLDRFVQAVLVDRGHATAKLTRSVLSGICG